MECFEVEEISTYIYFSQPPLLPSTELHAQWCFKTLVHYLNLSLTTTNDCELWHCFTHFIYLLIIQKKFFLVA
jgi:hypothetical protein